MFYEILFVLLSLKDLLLKPKDLFLYNNLLSYAKRFYLKIKDFILRSFTGGSRDMRKNHSDSTEFSEYQRNLVLNRCQDYFGIL